MGLWEGLRMWVKESLESYKQSLVGNSSEGSEDQNGE
jgi:hypothetical protein